MTLPKTVKHVSFVPEKTNCGKGSCGTCGGTRFAHGPYWYAYFHRPTGKMAKMYVGKDKDGWALAHGIDPATGNVLSATPKTSPAKAKAKVAPTRTPKTTTPATAAPKKSRIPAAWAKIFTRGGCNPKLACAILGVSPKPPLSKALVKTTYKAAIFNAHPDRGGDPDRAKAIIAAFKYIEPFLT